MVSLNQSPDHYNVGVKLRICVRILEPSANGLCTKETETPHPASSQTAVRPVYTLRCVPEALSTKFEIDGVLRAEITSHRGTAVPRLVDWQVVSRRDAIRGRAYCTVSLLVRLPSESNLVFTSARHLRQETFQYLHEHQCSGRRLLAVQH